MLRKPHLSKKSPGPKPRAVLTSAASACTPHGLIGLLEIGAAFAGRRDVLGARFLQNLFGSLGPLGIVAMDREQDTSLFDSAFVALGLVLGNAHSYQGPPMPPTTPPAPAPASAA